ncbi:hypothetical protein SEA_SKOG_122 [Gordonia phage Skog]|uniref:Uncharacterized protein n=1 Tax=Gordonia phage Skog TaxID=2704033 RepID=A0A6G6XJT4_9CAUD|nr:hypothetical protein KHQ85_gp122 [Gordonia phage Skog]QIG58274.1 hypothetical protein SEA_SKOG_122 [Gordonia phage Skog]
MNKAYDLNEIDEELARRGVSDEERHRAIHEIQDLLAANDGLAIELQIILTEDKRVVSRIRPKETE